MTGRNFRRDVGERVCKVTSACPCPGGRFVFADLRGAAEMDQLMAMLHAQTDWEQIEREDITAPVAAALEADDLRKRARIS